MPCHNLLIVQRICLKDTKKVLHCPEKSSLRGRGVNGSSALWMGDGLVTTSAVPGLFLSFRSLGLAHFSFCCDVRRIVFDCKFVSVAIHLPGLGVFFQ